MIYENKKYTAVVIGIIFVALLWVAHLLSFFSPSNGYGYDMLMRSYFPTKASERIIVIEIDSSYVQRGDEVWLALLNQLLRYDVQQIAFTFLPEQATEQFYQLAENSGKTVFGAQAINNSDKSEKIIQTLPRAIADNNIIYGLITDINQQNGVVREQHHTIKANGASFPSFEIQVAQQVLTDSTQLPKTQFKVNFIGNKNRIPQLNIQRVLGGGLVSELVSNRTVLIGINQHPLLSQYFTPVSSDQQLTSEVMFHAFALDTLLSNRQINTLPDWAFLLIISFIAGISLFLCQWLTFQMSILVSITITFICIVISGLILHIFYIWIPVTEPLLGQWLIFTFVWRSRGKVEDLNLDQMLLGLNSKLREKVHHVSFYNTDEPWDQLIAMINQLLHFNRLIFLEKVSGDHRLKEIRALNCTIDDIEEMRRDYERTPYSTAISENKPLLLKKIYLKKAAIDEQQYLAPLIFAGEVLGFWAFTISPKKNISKAKFSTLTKAFMTQISEILYYRQQWKKHLHLEKNKIWSYLRVEDGGEHLQQLNQSVTLMDKRISELQEVFNSINTPCVLYDLFGRILLVNKGMNSLAKISKLRIFNHTMLEFIVEISDYGEAEVRHLLQQIIFDHETISIPVVNKAMGRSFMLHVRPLQYENKQDKNTIVPDENQVFQIDGVLCELVDTTELKNLYELKEKMFERFYFQIRNDFSSILFALPLLGKQQLSPEEKQLIITTVEGKTDETLKTLALVKEQMDVEIEAILTNTLQCYPVNGKASIQRVLTKLQKIINKRKIKIHLKLPELVSLVFASQSELEVVLHATLLIMIEDTYKEGDIWIEAKEKEQNVIYYIHNNGIGISDSQLQKFEESQESETLDFQHAMRRVNRWGGSLNITSQLGKGSRVELLLRRFL